MAVKISAEPRVGFRTAPPRALALGVLLGVAGSSMGQALPAAPRPFVEELRQREREDALRAQQERSVDSRLEAQPPAQTHRLPGNEAPCFRIDRLALAGPQAEDFQWALGSAAGPQGDDTPIGRCLGGEGVNLVLGRVQQAIIARGYVTTRVLAGAQDLTGGVLTLTLVPGRIAAIRFDDATAATSLRTAIPARPGDLLNLRDIEQGLENLKRAPTAEADIQIEPSKAPDARPGDSDLVVKYTQPRRVRATLSLDDSGTEVTGRHQAGATVSVDNPLGLNDLFYVSANHSIDGSHLLANPQRGTEGQVLHYSLPYGNWLLGLTASSNRHRQTVAGFNEDYVYAGKSNNAEAKLSRLIYRDRQRKTTMSLRGFRRESRNFTEDTEIGVQHRVVGGWELGLNHREFIGEATLDGNLAYRRGTGAFGAIRAPEEPFDEGSSRMRIVTADLGLNLPFKLGEQTLRYSGLWRGQWNLNTLTPQDRFAIGGRYTVRGFDGEASLAGDRGWLVRNDIGWGIPASAGPSGAELYVGIDYGEVAGKFTEQLAGRHLAGGVIGLRGALRGLNYDLFVGAPISKPDGFETARVTVGFSLNYSF